jgi:nucleotide-binding universal stress UspA family protein
VNDEQDMVRTEVPWVDAEGRPGPKVVVAVDGSAGSRAALQFAVADAARRGVPLEAVIAYRWPDYLVDFDVMGGADVERMRARLRADAEGRVRALVDQVAAEATGPMPEVGVRAVHGPSAQALIQASQGADLLVVGSRGHGEFSSVLLGSTSMQVALHATCPVTVVHSPEARRHRLRLHRERRAAEPTAVG